MRILLYIMIRFIHLSDTHIDYKPQLEYIKNDDEIFQERIKGIKDAIEYAKNNNIKLIVHSGDVFNVPSPKLNFIYELEKILASAENYGIEFLIISGNHDQSKIKSSFNSLKMFDLVRNVHVFNEDGFYTVGDYEFMLIPAKYDWSKLKETFPVSLNKLISQSKSNKRILVTHIPISSANESFTFDVETLSEGTIDSDTIPDIFLYVALGHYHSMQQINNRRMYYAGSTSQLSFNEEFEKKYFLDIIIDDSSKTTVNPIEIKPNYPLHTVKINASYVTNNQDFNMLLRHELELNNKKYSLKNKIIRVIISNLTASVRLNLDREKLINSIKLYDPFGIKIIIEREKEVFNDSEDEDTYKLIGSPRDEVIDYLNKRNKRNPILDETNEEIFKKTEDKLKGDDIDY